jgi:hypothetical protein
MKFACRITFMPRNTISLVTLDYSGEENNIKKYFLFFIINM